MLNDQKKQTVAKLFESSKNAWIKGNNSGNDITLKKWESVSEAAENKAGKILSEFGVKVIMPGLDPVFEIDEKTFYNLDSLQTYINNK